MAQISNGQRHLPCHIVNEVKLPEPSENLIKVHCPTLSLLVTADFEPLTHFANGIYATHCRVIPNTEGFFHILLLNINNEPICLKNNTKMGHLSENSESEAPSF